MTPPPADDGASSPHRSIFADLTPMRRSPAFARLLIGSSIAGIGTMMTAVAVGLEVYDITASTFAVSLVGVIALVPMIIAGLYGGMLADAFDRRSVALISAVLACSRPRSSRCTPGSVSRASGSSTSSPR
ncbi:MFS transporter [Curtobacterium sp. RRHDQ10]|uniref:MFS transporter n=1 Tax=Curtobacterium phyllosphaerae TaxID=3413379 RepID=UPI003BF2B45A